MATIKIGRHPRPYHADDNMALAVLEEAHLADKIEVVESRRPEDLQDCTYVIDTGLVFSPAEGRYDHHQADAPTRDNGEPYSSFGLVWRDFGLKLCEGNESVWSAIDDSFVRTIDAIDNGIAVHTGVEGYRSWDIAALFNLFNPGWREEDELVDKLSLRLIALQVLKRVIVRVSDKEIARDKIAEALTQEQNGVVVLEQFMPWQDQVVSASVSALAVVFPTRDGSGFNVQTVPKELGNRAAGNRSILPTPEDAALALGEDLVFLHKGRFIGGAKTFDGAMQLAKMVTAV